MEDSARVSRLEALLLVSTVSCLALLPWLVPYWPAEEEPRRLAIAHAWMRSGAGILDPWYALLVAAGRLFGLLAAGRLMCSLAIAALSLAQWLLLRRLVPDRWRNVYLLLPLSTGPLLLRGGTPLMLGLALGLSAIALVAPRLTGEQLERFRLRWPTTLGVALLLGLAGLTSPLGLFLSLAALLLLAGRRLFRPATWPLAAVLALASVPALIRSVHEAGAAHDPIWAHARLNERLLDMLGGNLVAFSGWDGLLRRVPVLVLLAAAAIACRLTGLRGSGPGPAMARTVLGAFAIALLMPAVTGPPCSEMAADQLLWIACALAVTLPGWTRPRLAPAGLALAVGLTLVQSRAMREPSDAIAAVVEAGRSIPPGSRVLPLRFGAPDAWTIDPLRHAWGYVALERDIATPYLGGGGPLLSCASPLPWTDPGARLPHLGEDAATHVQHIDPHACFGVTEPAVDCTCAPWKQIRYGALLEAARAHDRVLVIAAPEEFLRLAGSALEPLYASGDVRVFAPRPGGDAGLLCESVSR